MTISTDNVELDNTINLALTVNRSGEQLIDAMEELINSAELLNLSDWKAALNEHISNGAKELKTANGTVISVDRLLNIFAAINSLVGLMAPADTDEDENPKGNVRPITEITFGDITPPADYVSIRRVLRA